MAKSVKEMLSERQEDLEQRFTEYWTRSAATWHELGVDREVAEIFFKAGANAADSINLNERYGLTNLEIRRV